MSAARFSLKLVLVVVCAPLVGCVGLVAVPVRAWQVAMDRLPAVGTLDSVAAASVRGGTRMMRIAAFSWIAAALRLLTAATCMPAGCEPSGVEMFVALSLLGAAYGLGEVLLFSSIYPKLFPNGRADAASGRINCSNAVPPNKEWQL
jgi:hypothetical protein